MKSFQNWRCASAAAALLLACLGGCPQNPSTSGNDNGAGPGTNNNGNDNTTGSGTGGDVSGSALSFNGTATGAILDEVSTTTGDADVAARKHAAALAISGDATGFVTDLDGNRLKDKDGKPYDDFPVDSDGTFSIDALPVGVELVLNIDVDGDGTTDLYTVFSIPSDGSSNDEGSAEIIVDPLSTLIYGKILDVIAHEKIDLSKLQISIGALFTRTRDAFEHLFGDSGIEAKITLDDVLGKTTAELADLFDSLVPEGARRALAMFASTAKLFNTDNVDDCVKAVAQILVQGGFIIADDPGGIDLSFLDSLAGVHAITFDDLNPGEDEQSGREPPLHPPTLYVSTLADIDRNFVDASDEDGAPHGPQGPIFRERLLKVMAEAYLDGKTISLGDLHHLLVDLDTGLGARLTYPMWNGPQAPPSQVFQGNDGEGVEIDRDAVRDAVDDLRVDSFDDDSFGQKKADLRNVLKEFLSDTIEPSFDDLFGYLVIDPIPGIDPFARFIRSQRAHLPFSRSGPARMFVLATADSFQDDSAAPVTVDLSVDSNGRVVEVAYNAHGEGAFYLGFGEQREDWIQTFFINVANGRVLHDRRGGPIFVRSDSDKVTFDDVDGEPFWDSFRQTQSNWPGAPALRVRNPGFDPDKPADPEDNPPDFTAFVLMTEFGPGGMPVRVDLVESTPVYSETGTYYLLFGSRVQEENLFELIDGDGTILEQTPGDPQTRVFVNPADIDGLSLQRETFTRYFGIEVGNPAYDPDGAPYYDDINENGVQDEGEPSFDHVELLGNPDDWRSTFVVNYYRRADNDGFVSMEDVAWDAETPMTTDYVDLVPRNFAPRMNAWRFGRPNLALNLLTAFMPPEFFDGKHALDTDTRLNPFAVIAMTSLAFDSIHNVLAKVDWDGPGPSPVHEQLINANFWTPPIDDPVQLMVDGFLSVAE